MSISQWEKTSKNKFGTTYRSLDNQELLIVPSTAIPIEHLAQAWQDVNGEKASIVMDPELGQGIVVPHHIRVTGLSINEIIIKLLQIYEGTGRILLDKNLNFFKDASGHVYTNEVFLALNLTEKHFEINQTDRILYETQFKQDILFNAKPADIVKSTLKALIFISQCRPDIIDLSYLYQNMPSILLIANGFLPRGEENLEVALNELKKYYPENEELCRVKNNCAEILNMYKTSKENELSIHSGNTRRKIQVLDELIENINRAHFLEDIIKTLQTFLPKNRELMLNPHHHGGLFRQVVKQCLALPEFKDISSIYTLKEECIEMIADYQKSKKTLARVKSFYSKSQDKIFELDLLIDQILKSNTPLDISGCLDEFKEKNKDLFKKQTGELMQCLENCKTKIDEYLDKNEHLPTAHP
ncbi:MAG: hypothetical protein EBQ95_05490 [Gammaproteobacteria bacterium]|nr:hypothetical protein [Gammaproteobacteria bacterium]